MVPAPLAKIIHVAIEDMSAIGRLTLFRKGRDDWNSYSCTAADGTLLKPSFWQKLDFDNDCNSVVEIDLGWMGLNEHLYGLHSAILWCIILSILFSCLLSILCCVVESIFDVLCCCCRRN